MICHWKLLSKCRRSLLYRHTEYHYLIIIPYVTTLRYARLNVIQLLTKMRSFSAPSRDPENNVDL